MKNTNKILLGVGISCIFVILMAFVMATDNGIEKALNKTTKESSKYGSIAVQANNSILNEVKNKTLFDKPLNNSYLPKIGKKGINFLVIGDKVVYYDVKGGTSKKYTLNESEWKDLINIKKRMNNSIDVLVINDFVIKKNHGLIENNITYVEIDKNKIYKKVTANISAKVEENINVEKNITVR